MAQLDRLACAISSAALILSSATAYADQHLCGVTHQPSSPAVATSPNEPIVVTPARREQQLIDAPVTTSVIGDEAICRAPSTGLTDLMRTVPGVNIARTSARDVNVTIRGATGTLADSTLVLLDGRSVYQDFFGFVMWDFFPIDSQQIEQIEVIRGPASAVWGANAMTGVVNVISKTPRELAGQNRASMSVQFGQFDRTAPGSEFDGGGMFAVDATYAEATSSQLAFKISGGLLTQEAFLRPSGTIPGQATTYPDFPNRGTTQPRLDARADYDLANGGRIIIAGGLAYTEGLIHTGLGPLDIEAGTTFKYGRVAFQRNGLKLQMFVNALDGEGPLLLQRGPDFRRIEPRFENQSIDVEFSNRHLVGTRHLVSYGGNLRDNRFDLTLAPRGDSRTEGGVYLEDEIYLSDHLRIVVGSRIDRFSGVDRTPWSPRTALIVKPRANQAIRMSYNRAFRAPSFTNSYLEMAFLQAFRTSGGEFIFPSLAEGNLDLVEESLTAYELGYTGAFARLRISAAAYVNQTRNMIQFTQTGRYSSAEPPPCCGVPPAAADTFNLPSSYSYLNFERVTDRGVELGVDARLTRTITAFANYTVQDEPAAHGFDARELNRPPAHAANAGVSVDTGRYFAHAAGNYQDRAFWQDVLDDRYHGITDAFTLVTVGAGLRSGDRRLTVGFRVENLFNRSVQQHVFGDVLKRTVLGEVRVGF